MAECIKKISRRTFITSTGIAAVASGGLFFSGKFAALQNKAYDLLPSSSKTLELFVHIGTNNRITLYSHRVEMGQGAKDTLPLILADELEADWSLVDIIQAPSNPAYGDQDTAGSKSIRLFFDIMREYGATVRTMLERAAAKYWRTEISECQAINHAVIHKTTGRKLSYGDLAELAMDQPIPSRNEIKFKPASEFRYIGKKVAGVDLEKKVTGAMQYAADIRLPGMLYASIEHAPVIGAKLLNLDDSAARQTKGVIDILILPTQEFPVLYKPLHGVAVIATNSWAAITARRKLACRWSESKYSTRGSESLRDELLQKIKAPGNPVQNTMSSSTDIDFINSREIHEAVYTVPYLAHACMETPATIAHAKAWSCEVWASTQAPQAVQKDVANTLGLPIFRVHVNVQSVGGGFGRKSKGDYATQAALISQKTGKPICLMWTREDDIKFDYYHALSVQYYAATINDRNEITSWIQRAAYPTISSTFQEDADTPTGELNGGFSNTPFNIENFRAEVHSAKESVRIGWLRGVTSIQHSFANNSFADELAYKRNQKPVAHLLSLISPTKKQPTANKHLNHIRLRTVIETVSSRSGLNQSTDSNSGWGIAAHESYYSFCAAASKVSIQGNKITVNEIHIAFDCGRIINAEQVRAQLEGSAVWGLSLALMGEITVKRGQVLQSNFHDYPVLRINQCPVIRIYLIPSELPPSGVGESGVPPIAPSITNAIFSACGKRIRDLPICKYFDV